MPAKTVALISILMTVVGQVLLKLGMRQFGALAIGELPSRLPALVTNPFIVSGLTIYAISAFVWLSALSQLELGYAYPLISLGIVLVFLVSWLFLNESLPKERLLGSRRDHRGPHGSCDETTRDPGGVDVCPVRPAASRRCPCPRGSTSSCAPTRRRGLDRPTKVIVQVKSLLAPLAGAKWEVLVPPEMNVTSGAKSGTVDLDPARPFVAELTVLASAPIIGTNLSVEVTTRPPKAALEKAIQAQFKDDATKRKAGLELVGKLPEEDTQRRILGLTVTARASPRRRTPRTAARSARRGRTRVSSCSTRSRGWTPVR